MPSSLSHADSSDVTNLGDFGARCYERAPGNGIVLHLNQPNPLIMTPVTG